MPNVAQPGHPDTVVLVPMYNEAAVVAGVLADLQTMFSHIVVIDDGSTDDSTRIAQASGAGVIRHSTNLGQGAALSTGLQFFLTATDGSYAVTFDADGQHRVEDAVTMVETLRQGNADVVLGSRFLSGGAGVPPNRRVMLRAAAAWTRLTTGLRVTDVHNGLRALNRGAAARLTIRQTGMAHGSEFLHLIAKAQLECAESPVTVLYTDYSRRKGQRSINAVNILFDLAVARIRPAS